MQFIPQFTKCSLTVSKNVPCQEKPLFQKVARLGFSLTNLEPLVIEKDSTSSRDLIALSEVLNSAFEPQEGDDYEIITEEDCQASSLGSVRGKSAPRSLDNETTHASLQSFIKDSPNDVRDAPLDYQDDLNKLKKDLDLPSKSKSSSYERGASCGGQPLITAGTGGIKPNSQSQQLGAQTGLDPGRSSGVDETVSEDTGTTHGSRKEQVGGDTLSDLTSQLEGLKLAPKEGESTFDAPESFDGEKTSGSELTKTGDEQIKLEMRKIQAREDKHKIETSKTHSKGESKMGRKLSKNGGGSYKVDLNPPVIDEKKPINNAEMATTNTGSEKSECSEQKSGVEIGDLKSEVAGERSDVDTRKRSAARKQFSHEDERLNEDRDKECGERMQTSDDEGDTYFDCPNNPPSPGFADKVDIGNVIASTKSGTQQVSYHDETEDNFPVTTNPEGRVLNEVQTHLGSGDQKVGETTMLQGTQKQLGGENMDSELGQRKTSQKGNKGKEYENKSSRKGRQSQSPHGHDQSHLDPDITNRAKRLNIKSYAGPQSLPADSSCFKMSHKTSTRAARHSPISNARDEICHTDSARAVHHSHIEKTNVGGTARPMSMNHSRLQEPHTSDTHPSAELLDMAPQLLLPISSDENMAVSKMVEGSTEGHMDRTRGSTEDQRDRSRGSTEGHMDGSRGSTEGQRDRTRGSTEGQIDGSRGSTEGQRDGSRGSTEGQRDRSRGSTEGQIDRSRGSTEGHMDKNRESMESQRDRSRGSTEGHMDGARGSTESHMDRTRGSTESHMDRTRGFTESHMDRTRGSTESHMDRTIEFSEGHMDGAIGFTEGQRERSSGSTGDQTCTRLYPSLDGLSTGSTDIRQDLRTGHVSGGNNREYIEIGHPRQVDRARGSTEDHMDRTRGSTEVHMDGTRGSTEGQMDRTKTSTEDHMDRSGGFTEDHMDRTRGFTEVHMDRTRGSTEGHMDRTRGSTEGHMDRTRGFTEVHMDRTRGSTEGHVDRTRGSTEGHVDRTRGSTEGHVDRTRGSTEGHMDRTRGSTEGHMDRTRGFTEGHMDRTRGSTEGHVDRTRGSTEGHVDRTRGSTEGHMDRTRGSTEGHVDRTRGFTEVHMDRTRGSTEGHVDRTRGSTEGHVDRTRGSTEGHVDRTRGSTEGHVDRTRGSTEGHVDRTRGSTDGHVDRTRGSTEGHVDRTRGSTEGHVDRTRGSTEGHVDRTRGSTDGHVDRTRGSTEGHMDRTRGSTEGHMDRTRGSTEGHMDRTRGSTEGHVDRTRGSTDTHMDRTRGFTEGHMDRNRGSTEGYTDRTREPTECHSNRRHNDGLSKNHYNDRHPHHTQTVTEYAGVHRKDNLRAGISLPRNSAEKPSEWYGLSDSDSEDGQDTDSAVDFEDPEVTIGHSRDDPRARSGLRTSHDVEMRDLSERNPRGPRDSGGECASVDYMARSSAHANQFKEEKKRSGGLTESGLYPHTKSSRSGWTESFSGKTRSLPPTEEYGSIKIQVPIDPQIDSILLAHMFLCPKRMKCLTVKLYDHRNEGMILVAGEASEVYEIKKKFEEILASQTTSNENRDEQERHSFSSTASSRVTVNKQRSDEHRTTYSDNFRNPSHIGRSDSEERERRRTGSSVDRQHLQSGALITEHSMIKVSVKNADITTLKVDAIVNAANARLKHGGGVARAIAEKAGQELQRECQNFITKGERKLNVTGTFVSTGGKLPAKHVIHAVGPKWSYYGDVKSEECARDLRLTILNCLLEANRQGCRSIAIPSISAGKLQYYLKHPCYRLKRMALVVIYK